MRFLVPTEGALPQSRCREVVDRPLSASQSEIGPGRNPPIALWTSTWRPQLAPTRGQPRRMPTTRRRGLSVVASAAVVSRTSTRTAACTGSGCPPAYRASFRHLEAEHHRSRGARRYGSAPSRCQGWRHQGGCRRPRRSAPERCPSRPGSARRLRRGLGRGSGPRRGCGGRRIAVALIVASVPVAIRGFASRSISFQPMLAGVVSRFTSTMSSSHSMPTLDSDPAHPESPRDASGRCTSCREPPPPPASSGCPRHRVQ
jgi:hypothetical protein